MMGSNIVELMIIPLAFAEDFQLENYLIMYTATYTFVSATRYARTPLSRAVGYALDRALRCGVRSCQLERSITA